MTIDVDLVKFLFNNVKCRNCVLKYVYLSFNLSNDYQSLESFKLSKIVFKNYEIKFVQINENAIYTIAWKVDQYDILYVVNQIKEKSIVVHVIFILTKFKVVVNCETITKLFFYKICFQFSTQIQTKLMLKFIIDDE